VVITQTAVTLMAEILPDRVDPLRQLLETAGQDAAANALIPFGRLNNVHFARFFIMPAAQDLEGQPLSPRLLFLADIDGQAEPFLRSLCALASDGLDTIFAHCAGYPGQATLLDFLRAQMLPVAAAYVNTIGRTVEQIRQDAQLREAIQHFLDNSPGEWRSAEPSRVRAAIQAFVESEPALAWARQGLPAPDPRFTVGEMLHVVLTAIGVAALSPVILVGLPVWLYFLRRDETADQPRDVIPDDAWVQTLAAQEDHGIQNPFTSAGLVKPGRFRRFTASLVLWGTSFLTRHVFNHANLIGVKTIHFARWIFIDQKRRVIFASNYDGSLESYMDDFIDKIAWALNAAFSNGVDFPKTNWLILDGSHDEQAFKHFNLNHQLVAPFWYAAYQGLTALNIENNAAIRAGLYGPMSDSGTRAWLRRL
jgi:hypothetical protein